MASVGDRFKTGQNCDTSGSYAFDGYVDGASTPAPPTSEERVISLSKGGTFPPIRSSKEAAWWKLQRIT